MSVQQQIEQQLQAALDPQFMEVENESHMHSVPPNSETHFRVVLVSAQFEGKRQVGRHQQVYAVLGEQLEGPVHALALHLFTIKEWALEERKAPDSPNCLGSGAKT